MQDTRRWPGPGGAHVSTASEASRANAEERRIYEQAAAAAFFSAEQFAAQRLRIAALEGALAAAEATIGALTGTIAGLAADDDLAATNNLIAALTGRMGAAEAVLAAGLRYVSNEAMTVAQLRTAYPPAQHVGKLARVTDLFGELASSMIAETNGTMAYWRPTRTDFAKTMAMTAVPATLTPLGSAPTLRITGMGATTVNRTISADGAWPGHQKIIVADGLLVGGLLRLLNGTGGLIASLSTVLGGRTRLEFDGTDYFQV